MISKGEKVFTGTKTPLSEWFFLWSNSIIVNNAPPIKAA